MMDFKEIKRRIPLSFVLSAINHPGVVGKWPQMYGPCPLGCGVGKRPCSFHFGRNVWNCHKCNQSGNQVELYAKVLDLAFNVAAMELCYLASVPIPWIEDGMPGHRRYPYGEVPH